MYQFFTNKNSIFFKYFSEKLVFNFIKLIFLRGVQKSFTYHSPLRFLIRTTDILVGSPMKTIDFKKQKPKI